MEIQGTGESLQAFAARLDGVYKMVKKNVGSDIERLRPYFNTTFSGREILNHDMLLISGFKQAPGTVYKPRRRHFYKTPGTGPVLIDDNAMKDAAAKENQSKSQFMELNVEEKGGMEDEVNIIDSRIVNHKPTSSSNPNVKTEIYGEVLPVVQSATIISQTEPKPKKTKFNKIKKILRKVVSCHMSDEISDLKKEKVTSISMEGQKEGSEVQEDFYRSHTDALPKKSLGGRILRGLVRRCIRS